MPYYAVAKGRVVGIFPEWHMCQSAVKQFSGAKYKKFKTKTEAIAYLKENNVKHADDTESESNYESSQEIVNKVKEFWPEDVKCDVEDDDFLLLASAEVEGIPNSNENNVVLGKRKYNVSDGSSSRSKLSKHESKIWEPIGVKKYGNMEFPIDSEGYVICYTDGSCEGNGKSIAAAGFGVYFSENHILNTAKPVLGRPTNNVGEIQAAIYAIKLAIDLGIPKLCVSTDSQFLINSITLWVKNWKRNGWRTKDGKIVKNIDDYKELDEILSKNNIKIKWNYVKGHKGITGNERADRLARQGAQMYRDQNK